MNSVSTIFTSLNVSSFARFFDHTLLKPIATAVEIDKVCDEALEHCFATVCVNGFYVPQVAARLKGSSVMPIAVIGFPLGAMTTEDKVVETKSLIGKGAQEIDMVLNLGAFLGNARDVAKADMAAVVKAAGNVPVKVIIETAYLSPEQIKVATQYCVETGAAFVKTSTGFASRGASLEDVSIMAMTIRDLKSSLKIKASGGIRTLEAARAMIEAGAHRIGSSNSVALVKEFAALKL